MCQRDPIRCIIPPYITERLLRSDDAEVRARAEANSSNVPAATNAMNALRARLDRRFALDVTMMATGAARQSRPLRIKSSAAALVRRPPAARRVRRGEACPAAPTSR